jgi:biopolymer transport protein TolR
MAIEIGGDPKQKVRPSMNITPLVDVVLVLLIIFMVVTPLLTKQFWIQLPKEEKSDPTPPDPDHKPVVLSVEKDGSLKINADVVPREQLAEKLRRVFAARGGDHTLFFTADEEAPYGAAVEAMDIARAGGAVTIAVLTEKPKS